MELTGLLSLTLEEDLLKNDTVTYSTKVKIRHLFNTRNSRGQTILSLIYSHVMELIVGLYYIILLYLHITGNKKANQLIDTLNEYTVNGERFTGINFGVFSGFQEYRGRFS